MENQGRWRAACRSRRSCRCSDHKSRHGGNCGNRGQIQQTLIRTCAALSDLQGCNLSSAPS